MLVLPIVAIHKDVFKQIIRVVGIAQRCNTIERTTLLVLGVLVGARLLVTIVNRCIQTILKTTPYIPIEVYINVSSI